MTVQEMRELDNAALLDKVEEYKKRNKRVEIYKNMEEDNITKNMNLEEK